MSFGIALAGLDHWYTAFAVADIAQASGQVTLAGIAEDNDERRAPLGAKYPGAQIAADYRDLIACADVDLVAICASTDAAPGIARDALRAGKHVLSVKPPARTLAELDAVIAEAQTARRFYGSFEGMQRLHPKAQILQRLVRDEQVIGQPLSFHQIGHGPLPSPWPGQPSGAPSWWLDPARVPGGAWLDHAIYGLDLARFVLGGEMEPAPGSALIENRVHRALPLEDYGAALLRLRPEGEAMPPVTVFLEDTWAAKGGHGAAAQRLEVIGTEGVVRWDGGQNAWLVLRGNGEPPRVEGVPAGVPYFALDALAAALQKGDALPLGPDDARANLAACLSVYARANGA